MLLRLATFACVLFLAVSSFAGSGLPVGSLTSSGTTRISGIAVPSGSAVFAGDVIETGASYAVFDLGAGNSVTIGSNASVRVSRNDKNPSVELLKGMSRVQVRGSDVKLVASNWKLEARPDAKTGRTTADLLREPDGVVSVNVKEGELFARNRAGTHVAIATPGRPMLLPSAALPPAPPAPPQAGRGSSDRTNAALVGAYVVGAVAVAVGVAALVSGDEDDEEARRLAAAANTAATAAAAAAQAATTQIAALSAQVTALNTTITALRAQLVAERSNAVAVQALLARLGTELANLTSVQTQLSSLLSIAGTRPLTPAELDTLRALSAELSAIQGRVAAIVLDIGRLPIPPTPTT